MEFGIQVAIIGAIVAACQVAKKALWGEDKPPKWFILAPLVAGLVAAFFMTTPLDWQGVGLNAIIYGGLAMGAYSAGHKLELPGLK